MSRFQKFFEDGFRIRIKGKPSVADQIPVVPSSKDLSAELSGMDAADITNLSDLNKFRTLSSNREVQYRAFDEMSEDSIISSALEMYADDATQYNADGNIIWAESSDADVAAFANRLIDVLNLNANAWSHIFSMVKYGDLYLETFRDDEDDEDDPLSIKTINTATVAQHKVGSKMKEYIEAVIDPAEIFDLYKRGKTVGFIRVPNISNGSDDDEYGFQYIQQMGEITILPSDKFIHICMSNNTDRKKYTFKLQFRDDTSESGIKTTEYTVRRGKSILHDLYRIYKEMSLMEDSLILNRVTKSSLIRILQVEVGDMPKAQARELLKRVKSLIEQRNYMSKTDGNYSSMASPGPIENVIYVPTHDGKGAISSSNLGGDVDVKSIIDVDYFKNKLYAGLKVPKQFLGEDEGGGFSGGTSLTKLDSRYARTIKRVQTAYVSGITTLINLFAIDRGLTDHVNNFTIKMQSPSTVEDAERDETLGNRINTAGSLLDMLTEEIISTDGKKEVVMEILSTMLGLPEIAKILQKDIDSGNEESEDELGDESEGFDDEDSGGGFGGFGGGGPSRSPSPMGDMGEEPSFSPDEELGGGGEENRDIFDGIRSIPEEDNSEPIDFGDFESEV